MHWQTALDYRQAFRDGRWLDLARAQPRPGHPHYPPVYHFALASVVERPDYDHAGVWLNLVFLGILLASAGRIAWRLGGPGPAAATVLALGLSSRILHYYREAFVDLSAAAWTAAVYAMALESDFFKKRKPAVAAGVFAGLALLSKWSTLIYLTPLAMLAFWTKPSRKGISIAAAVAATIASPWYLLNAPLMIPRIFEAATLGHKQGNPLTWTWANWTYYPHFMADCFTVPGLLLMAGGAAWGWRKLAAPARTALAAWVAFSYVACTLVPSKDFRYFLPVLAAAPALGLAALPAPALGLAAALAVASGASQRQPVRADWRHDEILAEVEQRREGRPATVCLLSNHRFFNATTLSWEARRRGFGLSFGGYQSEIPEFSDFVLMKTGDPGVLMSPRTHAILDTISAGGGLFARAFSEARRFPLPDGSEAVLYQLRKDLPSPALIGEKRYASLTVRKATLSGVRLRASGGGRFHVSADELSLAKLPAPIRGLRVELEGARLLEDKGRLYVLSLERVRVTAARALWAELGEAISRRGKVPVGLSAQGGVLTASAAWGLPVTASLEPRLDPAGLSVALRGLTLAGLRLPGASGRWTVGLGPHAAQPFTLDLSTFQLTSEGLTIGI